MRISHVEIYNYRSIRKLNMHCEPLVVMIGANNSGKSNILSALEFALSTSAKPSEDDFFAFRDDEGVLWVELTFHELTDQERTTFKRYLRADDTIRIRKTARLGEGGKVEISYNGYIQEPEEWWLQRDAIERLTKREEANETPLKKYLPEAGRLSKAKVQEAQEKYIEEHRDELSFSESLENGPLLGQRNVAGGILPDLYLIPAVRDLSDETKVKATTAFGRLLNRAVREMAERDPRFLKLKEGLEELVRSLNSKEDPDTQRPEQLTALETHLEQELRHWGVTVSIEVEPPAIEKIFELGTNLHLDDGIRTLAEYKGHGLQRAVIFALVRAWASALRTAKEEDNKTVPRASSESILFAMEEPELFLHPHAQRRLARAIQEISDTPQHQVFVCTHSTHFVDLDRYKNICVVTKENSRIGTLVRQCAEDLFPTDSHSDRKKRFHMAHWINPDRGEIFFAKKVVFVEGETEKTVLPFLAQKLGCFDPDISVIDCGAKHNLPLYITIANAFKLPYLVVHDEDPLDDPIPDKWNEDMIRAKRRTYELNEEIRNIVTPEIGDVVMLSPKFEKAAGVSKSQVDKKGKALAALDHFDKMPPDEIPAVLKQLIKKIYGQS